MRGEYNGTTHKILLFGGFRIENEITGQLKLTGKRGAAIIAYLAMCPGMSATREKLADLLWPDSNTENSRNNLRQMLSVMRQDLSAANVDLVDFGRESIQLKPSAVLVDVGDFEAGISARSAHELDKALANYAGPFLDGLYLGGNGFDDWAASERDRLLNRALESFERLARLVDDEAGLALADRLLAMDPGREASYRLKIELLVANGQRDKALRAYETCRTVLKRELGVDISPETRDLWQSLQSMPEKATTQPRTNSAASSSRLDRKSVV